MSSTGRGTATISRTATWTVTIYIKDAATAPAGDELPRERRASSGSIEVFRDPDGCLRADQYASECHAITLI